VEKQPTIALCNLPYWRGTDDANLSPSGTRFTSTSTALWGPAWTDAIASPEFTAAGIVRTFSRGWIEHQWKSDLKSDSASRSFLLKTKAGKTLPAETSKYSASCSAPLAHDLQHLRSCPCDDKLPFADISLLQMEHPRPQNNWRGQSKFGEEMEDSKIA